MGITTTPGAPGANASASGGKLYAYNAITNASNTAIAPANPQRNSITFHNPGANDILVSPTTTLGSLGASQIALVPTTAALGGGRRVFSKGTSMTLTRDSPQAS